MPGRQMVRTIDAAPLALALIGCGRVVERYHLPALQRCSEWNVIGACDPLGERREWMRRQLEDVRLFESVADLLDDCRPHAALVATPPSTHCEIVVRALEMGIDVLVEKPMALSAADAEKMWQVSRRVGKRVAVGFSRRFKRTYRELRRRLALVPPGDLQSIRFDLAGNAEAWQDMAGFLGDDDRGGGALDDLGSHQLDLLPWLVGQRVRRMRARRESGSDQRWQRIAFELEFESGLTALCSVEHGPRREEHLRIELRDRQLVAHQGRLLELRRHSAAWMRTYGRLRRFYDRVIGRPRPEETLVQFVRQLQSFAVAARSADGPVDVADARSGIDTVRLVETCRRSMRSSGSWVTVESSSA